jgi:hypothetical protein
MAKGMDWRRAKKFVGETREDWDKRADKVPWRFPAAPRKPQPSKAEMRSWIEQATQGQKVGT